MGDLLARVEKKPREGQHIAAVADVIDKEKLIRNELFGDYPDPHLWFDLQLWKVAAAEAGKALQGADPSHAESYAAATKAYLGMFRFNLETILTALGGDKGEDQ